MTAQEAAKDSWTWLRKHQIGAAIFAIGSCIVAIAASYDRLNHAMTWISGSAAVAGPWLKWTIEYAMQAEQKRTLPAVSEVVSEKVVSKMEGKIDLLVDCHEKMAAAVVLLTAQQAETEKTRAIDHRENTGQLAAVKQDIQEMKVDHNEMREAIVHVGQAVEAVNKDFKMRPFRGGDGK